MGEGWIVGTIGKTDVGGDVDTLESGEGEFASIAMGESVGSRVGAPVVWFASVRGNIVGEVELFIVTMGDMVGGEVGRTVGS